MSKINTESNSLYNIEFVQDITPETAANYSGGAVTVTDVTLFSEAINRSEGFSFGSNKAIEDLSEYGFDDATQSISNNNGQTWRFYEDANFQGNYIDVGPNTAMDVGEFGLSISSFQAINQSKK